MLQAVRKRKTNYISILVVCVFYFLNKKYLIFHTAGWFEYFCKCHLNDILCPFLVLGISQIMLIWAGYEIKCLKHYISISILMGIVWEYIAPIINPKSVTDVIDILCYILGTFLYYVLWKHELKKQN